MTRVLKLQAPDAIQIADMSIEEAERYASDLADKGLDLVGDAMFVGINAVSLDQTVEAGIGVWVQWTRACCDRRHRMREFEEPQVEDFDIPATRMPRELHNQHLESQMRRVRLEGADHQRA